jgi:hypothetical protein
MTASLTWLSAVLTKPDLASWLQAFAAIVALVISVWAAWRTGAVERQRDLLQARGIAVAIYPEILKLKETACDTRRDLAQHQSVAGHLVGQSVAATIQGLAHIDVPPMIDRNIDRLFMLGGTAGPTCLQLVGILYQYNTFVDQLVARMMMMNSEQWNAAVPRLRDHLTLLDQVIEKCEHEVGPLHAAIKG